MTSVPLPTIRTAPSPGRAARIVRTASAACGALFAALAMVCLATLSSPAHAVIEIEITKGADNAIPIAIVPFGWSGEGQAPVDIAAIVADDLRRSGNFDPLNREDLVSQPVSGDVPRYSDWRLTGADFLLVGATRASGEGYTVQFQLFDVAQQTLMTGFSFQVTDQTLRSAAHQIADEVYEAVLGISGAFNTQIAFVSVEGAVGARTYRLQLADADGQSPQAMLTSPYPILSPAWAPDGIRIAYVSFEDRVSSAVFVQDRQRGTRTKVLAREGINGAPAFSPDGSRLAVALSYEGDLDVYVLDLDTAGLTRVTDGGSIDTEPAWIDDDTIVFTSDRSGGPQLYEVPASGGRAKRVTFDGNYNADAAVSPDGRTLAFVHGYGAGFQIAVQDRASGLFQTLTQGTLDESPTFSPNGQMIMYATEKDGSGTLGAVSLDGAVVQSLALDDGGDVREPAWSPYSQ